MHCSIWRFEGDPEDLARRYAALMAELPESNHRLHAAARTDEGLLIFDTCPSEEVYRSFFESGPARDLFARHGLVPVSREDHPVLRAYARGERVD